MWSVFVRLLVCLRGEDWRAWEERERTNCDQAISQAKPNNEDVEIRARYASDIIKQAPARLVSVIYVACIKMI